MLMPDNPPTDLYFLDRFNKSHLHDHYVFLMKDDPVLDTVTFSKIFCLGPERYYLMHRGLCDIKNGLFLEKPEFKIYKQALEGFGNSETSRAYFEKANKVFFEQFRLI